MREDDRKKDEAEAGTWIRITASRFAVTGEKKTGKRREKMEKGSEEKRGNWQLNRLQTSVSKESRTN